jgi:hypothetical protein
VADAPSEVGPLGRASTRAGAVAFSVANQGPVVVHATPDETTLEPCAFTGNGLSVSARGRLAGGALDADAHGTVALATLAGMIPRGPVRLGRAAGDVGIAVQARGPVTAPTFDATASIAEPLAAALLAFGRPAFRSASGRSTPRSSRARLATARARRAAAAGHGRRQRRRLRSGGAGHAGSWASTGSLDATAARRAALARQAAQLDRAEGGSRCAHLDGAFPGADGARRWTRAPGGGARKAGTAVSIPSLRASLEATG